MLKAKPLHRVLLLALCAVLTLMLLPARALAADIVVTSLNDSGPGSLRQAIADANLGDTISFDQSILPGTITLSSQLTITKAITINGPGTDNLTISGNHQCRVFEITDNVAQTTAKVYINNLTIANGKAVGGAGTKGSNANGGGGGGGGGGGTGGGGGILAKSNLFLAYIDFIGNEAYGGKGGDGGDGGDGYGNSTETANGGDGGKSDLDPAGKLSGGYGRDDQYQLNNGPYPYDSSNYGGAGGGYGGSNAGLFGDRGGQNGAQLGSASQGGDGGNGGNMEGHITYGAGNVSAEGGNGGEGGAGCGGAVCVVNGKTTIVYCNFANNYAYGGAGGRGGGSEFDMIVEGGSLPGYITLPDGSGIFFGGGGHYGGDAKGGAIFCGGQTQYYGGAEITVKNSVFSQNDTFGGAGGRCGPGGPDWYVSPDGTGYGDDMFSHGLYGPYINGVTGFNEGTNPDDYWGKYGGGMFYEIGKVYSTDILQDGQSFALGGVNRSFSADGTDYATLTVKLLDKSKNNTPIFGEQIVLDQGGGHATVTPARAVTDYNGIAVFKITNTTAETVTFSAKDITSGFTLTRTVSLNFVHGAVDANQSTVSSSQSSLTADGKDSTIIDVNLADKYGNVITTTKNVSLSQDGGATVLDTAQSNGGYASFWISNTTPGTVTYTVMVDGVVLATRLQINFLGVSPTNSTVTTNRATVIANGSDTAVITVTVKDADGKLFSGRNIRLDKSGGSSTISPASVVSDNNGRAVFTVSNTSPETVTYTATDIASNIVLNATATVEFTPMPQTAATPTASPPGGVYEDAQTVTLSCDTYGTTIYYTLDGNGPSTNSTPYSEPILVPMGTTLKAIAARAGMYDSAALTATYTQAAMIDPVASPAGAVSLALQTVTLTCATPGVSIFYTLDGSTPGAGSTLYIEPITVRAPATLKAIAIKSARSSNVITAQFTLPSSGAIDDGSIWDGMTFNQTMDATSIIYFGGSQWHLVGYYGAGAAFENGCITLLRKNVGPNLAYNLDSANGDYLNSNLYNHINSLLSTFSEAEKAAMRGRTLDGVAGTQPSGQKLWPLSTVEINLVNLDFLDSAKNGNWWTRTTFYSASGYFAGYRTGDKQVHSSQVTAAMGVRPAFSLSLDSVLRVADTPGGKKLTLIDDDMAQPTLTFANTTNGTATLRFGVDVASAYLLGASYGQSANGVLSVPLTGVADGAYTLKIFAEQANGAYITDYASPPIELTLTVAGGQGTLTGYSGATDSTLPTVVSASLAGGNIVITFSQAIAATGTVSLSGGVGALAGGSFDATRLIYSIPCPALADSTEYTITIAGFTNAAGNTMATDSSHSFTSADIAAPTVTGVSPANGATEVPNAGAIAITFSEPVVNSGEVSLDGGATALSGGQLNANRRTLTVLYSGLSDDTSYTITVSGFMDDAGNTMAPESSYSFTTSATPDTTPPGISSLAPAMGAKGVPVDGSIILTFNETIGAEGTVSTDSGSLAGSFDSARRVYTVPYTNWAYSTNYIIWVEDFADMAGNVMLPITSYNFTTDAAPDVTPPTVTGLSPAHNAAGVAVSGNIIITFSEAIGTLGTVELDNGIGALNALASSLSGGVIYTIPYAGLEHDTEYNISIAGFMDAAGNTMADYGAYRFTTVGSGEKSLTVGTQSGDLTEGTAGSASFSLDTANIAGGDYSAALDGEPGGVTADDITIANNSGTLILDMDATVAADTYALTLTLDGATSAEFYLVVNILDSTAPTVSSVTPAGTDVAINGNIVISFDEEIATTGTVSLDNGPALATSGASWNAAHTVYTIPYSGLAYSTSYTIDIAGFGDAAGNTMAEDSRYSFTTSAKPGGGGDAGGPGGSGSTGNSSSSPAPDPTPDPTPVLIPATDITQQLVIQNVDDMAANAMSLSVQAGNIHYEIPAAAIDTAAILAALGAKNAADVPITITINPDISIEAQAAVAAALADGVELVIPPMEFKITATYNGQTVEIETFNQYVSRSVEITAEQAARITTAIVVNQDGTTRHMPTRVYEKDGKWYAEISSLTNSTYVLVSNQKTFADANGKWYESSVNELAGRMVISGLSEDMFAGERDITRAEFAALIIRALGLPATGNGAAFEDVSPSAWYCGAVGTAYEYGLASGTGVGQFSPNQKITRQEAMLMIQRAAKIAGFAGVTANLNAFTDAESASAWALDAAEWNVGSGLVVGSNGMLRPLDNITRAETAALVLKLLQKAGLVDVRTKL